MFRIKVTRYKKGNISIGILIIMSIVLVNLTLMVVSIANIYRGSRLNETKVYKEDKTIIEKSVTDDKIENLIIAKLNDFIKDIEKNEKSLKEAFEKFKYTYIDSDKKYGLGYDLKYKVFFLDEKGKERKYLNYFIEDGIVRLKLKK